MPHIEKLRFETRPYPNIDLYPFNLPLLDKTSAITFPGPLTFFAGDNGTGKSTILRAISRGCGIHIWEAERRRRYLKSPFENSLHHYMEIVWKDTSVPGSFFSSELFSFSI